MNFMEAMQLLSEDEHSKVIREGDDTFIFNDSRIYARGRPPRGLQMQRIGRGQDAVPFTPTLDDVFAEDWSVYEPTASYRR